jgi:phosphoribosylformylglycinamidine synthase PurS subunit
MKAKVIVMPKAAVLDPQGNAVRDAMRHLGMPEVRSVRIGKYMEIDVDGKNGDLEARLHDLCRDLLSNPVIEDYELLRLEAEDSTFANPLSHSAPAGQPATARQRGVGSRKQKGRGA